jgi:hypothetical protein
MQICVCVHTHIHMCTCTHKINVERFWRKTCYSCFHFFVTLIDLMFRIVFWDVLPCKIIVDNYFTRQYILEDNSEHHTRRRENLIHVYIGTLVKAIHPVPLITHTFLFIWSFRCEFILNGTNSLCTGSPNCSIRLHTVCAVGWATWHLVIGGVIWLYHRSLK